MKKIEKWTTKKEKQERDEKEENINPKPFKKKSYLDFRFSIFKLEENIFMKCKS
jgi:hypothetical protein